MAMNPDLAFKKALAVSKNYTDETVIGGGAIRGKNCKIKSITGIDGGHRVTFEWTLDDGTTQTSIMNVMDGEDGATGPKGDKGDKGNTGDTGATGAKGDAATIRVGSVISGESPSVVNGGTTGDAVFNFVLPKGDKGDRGPTGANGKDGQDGKSFEIKARFATYEELIEAYPHGPENTGDAYFVGTTSNPDLYVWVTEDAEWVNNGPIAGVKGDKGDKGDTGDDGFSPVANVTKVGDTVTITVRDKTGQTTETVKDGADGQDGADGDDGVGIASIAFKEKDADGNNVYTITLTNGDEYDFTAPKGDNGAGGAYFGTSNTSGATATKVVTTTNEDFELFTGADIIVKFSYDDTAGACLLKVDGTTAKAIKQNGSDIEAGVLTADNVYEFVYTGSYFEMVSGGSSMAIEDIDQSDFTLANKQLSLQPSRRIFPGTKAQYEALTEAEKKRYDYLASPDEFSEDVANAVTDGDKRPVSSDAVFDKFTKYLPIGDVFFNNDFRSNGTAPSYQATASHTITIAGTYFVYVNGNPYAGDTDMTATIKLNNANVGFNSIVNSAVANYSTISSFAIVQANVGDIISVYLTGATNAGGYNHYGMFRIL